MSRQHTPGPWTARVAGEIGEIFIDSDEGPIADILPVEDGEAGEADANARLIAAAPELLAALKAIAATDKNRRGFFEWVKFIVAIPAIEKAEGVDPGGPR